MWRRKRAATAPKSDRQTDGQHVAVERVERPRFAHLFRGQIHGKPRVNRELERSVESGRGRYHDAERDHAHHGESVEVADRPEPAALREHPPRARVQEPVDERREKKGDRVAERGEKTEAARRVGEARREPAREALRHRTDHGERESLRPGRAQVEKSHRHASGGEHRRGPEGEVRDDAHRDSEVADAIGKMLHRAGDAERSEQEHADGKPVDQSLRADRARSPPRRSPWRRGGSEIGRAASPMRNGKSAIAR